jgi:hypothetical protein
LSCRDSEYFPDITSLIEDLFSGESGWKIRFYDSKPEDDYDPKAAVIAGFDRYTLIVDRELWNRAKAGEWFANFVLAHELGHIEMNHHKFRSVIKHYRLVSNATGMANIPPTLEEYEANLWAVFFQCGKQLENPKWDPVELARAARTEVTYVKRAQGYFKVPLFRRRVLELRSKNPAERQVF